MSQPIKNLSRCLCSIGFLWAKQLSNEFSIVHCADNICQNCRCREFRQNNASKVGDTFTAFVDGDSLRLKSLLEDIHHFPAHVDNNHGHRVVRHGCLEFRYLCVEIIELRECLGELDHTLARDEAGICQYGTVEVSNTKRRHMSDALSSCIYNHLYDLKAYTHSNASTKKLRATSFAK